MGIMPTRLAATTRHSNLIRRSDPGMTRETGERCTMRNELTCPKCRYTWTPRKADPKQCPNCTYRLWRGKRAVEEGGKGNETTHAVWNV